MCKNNICFIGISQYCSDPIFVHQSQPDGYVSFGWIRIGKFCHLWCEFHLELRVRSNVFSVSYQKDLVLSQNIICGLFFRLLSNLLVQSYRSRIFRFDSAFSLGFNFFVPSFVRSVVWGLVFLLVCDPLSHQDFQLPGTRMCFADVLVDLLEVATYVVRSESRSDSYGGLPCPLVWRTWIAPEWLRRPWQSLHSL